MKANLESEYRIKIYEFRNWVRKIWFIGYVIVGIILTFYSSQMGFGILLAMIGILPLLTFTTRTIRRDVIYKEDIDELERFIDTLPTKRET